MVLYDARLSIMLERDLTDRVTYYDYPGASLVAAMPGVGDGLVA